MAQPILNCIPRVSALLTCGLSLSLLLQSPIQAKPLSIEAVADRLSGLLVHELEGDRQIHMTTCLISNPEDLSSTHLYLYQEQARDDKIKQPYRQRFLRIEAISPEEVASVSFRPAQQDNWVGFCQKEVGDRLITNQDLLSTHCTVTLHRKGRKFIGTTPEEGCRSSYRGAAVVKNRIILTQKGMKTYDQGFDANGNRVWGSDGTPYTFKKVSP